MTSGYKRHHLDESEAKEEKPGRRWELSPKLDVDAFNVNIAILDPGERLSQNHFHYHEDQEELVHVTMGDCRVDVVDDWFIAGQGDTVQFDAGQPGTHLVHNPFEEQCRLIAIGWPPEGRYPVEQVETMEALLARRE